jgi:hypothetical protein
MAIFIIGDVIATVDAIVDANSIADAIGDAIVDANSIADAIGNAIVGVIDDVTTAVIIIIIEHDEVDAVRITVSVHCANGITIVTVGHS